MSTSDDNPTSQPAARRDDDKCAYYHKKAGMYCGGLRKDHDWKYTQHSFTEPRMAQPAGEAPRACDWCGMVPAVVKGAGYDYSVECQTETCVVQPSTVGIRGRKNAIKAWNTRASQPATAPNDAVLPAFRTTKEAMEYAAQHKIPTVLPAIAPTDIHERARRAVARLHQANMLLADPTDAELKEMTDIITAEFK